MFQGTDYWIPGKKYMGDGVFPEKLCTIDLNSITMETIEIINSNFITHPEWDVLAAGKVLVLAEVLGKWMFAIKDYHIKRYGNTFCGVFKRGIQNWKYFCLKINIPEGSD